MKLIFTKPNSNKKYVVVAVKFDNGDESILSGGKSEDWALNNLIASLESDMEKGIKAAQILKFIEMTQKDRLERIERYINNKAIPANIPDNFDKIKEELLNDVKAVEQNIFTLEPI